MQLLGIAGALRRTSTNKGMLRAARAVLPEGTDLLIADIGDLPLYDMDEDPTGGDAGGAPNQRGVTEWPAAVARLRRQVVAADGVLVGKTHNDREPFSPNLRALLGYWRAQSRPGARQSGLSGLFHPIRWRCDE